MTTKTTKIEIVNLSDIDRRAEALARSIHDISEEARRKFVGKTAVVKKKFYNGQQYGKSWPNLHGKIIKIYDAGYFNGRIWVQPESERNMTYIMLSDVELAYG